MIKIKKGESPAYLLGDTVKNRIKKALIEKNNHVFPTYYYGNKKEVKPFLKTTYNNKCCYCERNEEGGIELQVEHFRPKKTPKECETKKHSGYYWLGYEWSNLLLSCSTCNKYKGTSFPIDGNRIDEPNVDEKGELILENCKPDKEPLVNEKAFLFNPDVDRVFDHFKFEADGNLKSETKKGKTTIKLFKLNDAPLLTARNRIVNDFIDALNLNLLDYKEKYIKKEGLKLNFRRSFRKMKHQRKRSETHTFFRYYFYSNFEYFVKNKNGVEKVEKEQIIKAYKQFIHGKL